MSNLDTLMSDLLGLNTRTVDKRDVAYLDKVCLRDGEIRPLPATLLYRVMKHPQDMLQWCNLNAIYQYPTTELLGYLKERIGGRGAIEIGAGRAGVGKALGIHATDSYQQTRPDMIAYYSAIGQKTNDPPAYVEKLDAIEAIQKYRPQVVIGCYCTHKHQEGMKTGNQWGIDEHIIIEMLKSGFIETYIHVGNEETHSEKPLLNHPHTSFKAHWLVTRSFDQMKNVIWEWNYEDSNIHRLGRGSV